MSEKLTCEDEQEYPLKDHSLVFWDDGGMSIHSSLFLTVEELSEDEVEVMVSKYWGKKLGVCNGTVYCTNSICGGTGFIGKQLVPALKAKGHEVTVISRSAGPGKITWDELRQTSKLPPCEAVVNLAGEDLLNPRRKWDDAYKRDVVESRHGTNKLLVECMKNAETPPAVWVASSATGYYPHNSTEEFTEDYVNTPTTYLEQVTFDWEEYARVPENLKDKIRSCIIRIAIILGNGGGVIQSSIWPFWLGLGGRLGSGQQYFPWIHIDDIVGVYMRAIENEEVHGILNGVAPEIVTNSEFASAFASALWRPAWLPVPEFVLKFIFGEERKDILLSSMKVIPKRLLESGYKFKFPEIRPALVNIVSTM